MLLNIIDAFAFHTATSTLRVSEAPGVLMSEVNLLYHHLHLNHSLGLCISTNWNLKLSIINCKRTTASISLCILMPSVKYYKNNADEN